MDADTTVLACNIVKETNLYVIMARSCCCLTNQIVNVMIRKKTKFKRNFRANESVFHAHNSDEFKNGDRNELLNILQCYYKKILKIYLPIFYWPSRPRIENCSREKV